MRFKLTASYHQQGIGLLELMLALAIIAVLIVMATRYFEATSQSQQINTAHLQILEIQQALYKWKQRNGDYGDLLKSGSVNAIKTLAEKGYVTQAITQGETFSGSSFEIGGSDNAAVIYLKKIPLKACKTLAKRVTGAVDDCNNNNTVQIPVQ